MSLLVRDTHTRVRMYIRTYIRTPIYMRTMAKGSVESCSCSFDIRPHNIKAMMKRSLEASSCVTQTRTHTHTQTRTPGSKLFSDCRQATHPHMHTCTHRPSRHCHIRGKQPIPRRFTPDQYAEAIKCSNVWTHTHTHTHTRTRKHYRVPVASVSTINSSVP